MEKIIIFGVGENLRAFGRTYEQLADGYFDVLEFWDNSAARVGERIVWQGREYHLTQPHAIADDVRVVITAALYEAEIRAQLLAMGVAKTHIHSRHYLFSPLKSALLERYGASSEPDMRAHIDCLREHDLYVWAGSWQEKYAGGEEQFPIEFDEERNLPFSYWHGRRIYLPRELAGRRGSRYLNGLALEQDECSPHYYGDYNQLPDGGTVIDCGAAEGIFSLDIVERADRIYLIEGEERWLEPLRATFAPWQDRVRIVPRWVADYSDAEHVTLDELAAGEHVRLVKMDIEGAERMALAGATELLQRDEPLTVIACSYHRHGDEEYLTDYLRRNGFTTTHSAGYMWFPFETPVQLELRRGLVVGRKR